MVSRTTIRNIAAAMVALSLGAGASAEIRTCPGMGLTVSAPTSELAQRVCAVARQGRDMLNACNLVQTDPVRVDVVPKMSAEHAACFGVYVCDENRVQMLTPKAMAAAITPDDPLSNLPMDAFFDSTVVHELAHVFAYQTRGGPGGSVIEDEYIAYAMQTAFLPKAPRDAFLAAMAVATPVTLEAINPFILMLNPNVFRARAYLHFSQEPNGCAFVQKVLDGSAGFILDAP